MTDASVLVAISAREAGTYAPAMAQMRQYVSQGCPVYAPGVIVAEALYALCRNLVQGVLTPDDHRRAVRRVCRAIAGILPPPLGDRSLAARAEQIRGNFGCSRSADGLYIALAEQLAASGPTELVTFDAGMPRQAALASPGVFVRLLIVP